MFRPESLNSKAPAWTASRHHASSLQQGQQSQTLGQSSDIDALIDLLVPEGLSPNKRAIIECLVTRWAAEAKTNVA